MLYAAYGSNMNLEQMAFRCPYSVVVGKGMINNYKLKFSYHADIVPSAAIRSTPFSWQPSNSAPLFDGISIAVISLLKAASE